MTDGLPPLNYGSAERPRRWWEPTRAAFVGLLVAIVLAAAFLAFAYWIGSGLDAMD